MKFLRLHVLTIFVVATGVVLVAFSVWCFLLVSEVSTLRDEVSTRVGWLQRLHALQSEASSDPTEAQHHLEQVCRAIEQEPSVGSSLRGLAAAPADDTTERAARLVIAIRDETAQRSQALGRTWSSINWLAGIAIALAVSTLGLLVYVRFVLLHQARRTVAGLQVYLRDADRLAAVGTLAAGVAHELSNPLTFVVTSLELLNQELADSSAHELASDALRGTERVMGIVRDLRAIARPTQDELSPCDVEACIDAALNITRREIQMVAHVVRDYGAVPRVLGSDARLGQLFLNLLINAAHAMADGTRSKNELRITTRAEPPGVVIEIRDTGPGIPEELRGRVFEPFVTSKPLGKGTGLGLFVCHNIVRSLDGSIDLESSERGTTVTIRFPPGPKTWPEIDVRDKQASRDPEESSKH